MKNSTEIMETAGNNGNNRNNGNNGNNGNNNYNKLLNQHLLNHPHSNGQEYIVDSSGNILQYKTDGVLRLSSRSEFHKIIYLFNILFIIYFLLIIELKIEFF